MQLAGRSLPTYNSKRGALVSDNYPFLGILWSMFIFFLWIAWFMLLFKIFGDLFRRHDIGGGAKCLWIIFVVVVPFLGVFVYLIVENHKMADRDAEQMAAAQQQFDSYVKSVATNDGASAEIDRAKALLDGGTITQDEFNALKAKALA
jgi:putative oligomerization/nucleic acid binding protein/phospholipase D-like protein